MWRGSERYDFENIDGLQSSYSRGEPIVFDVSGLSDSLAVEPDNGFDVVATIFELPKNIVNRAKITYFPDKRAWQARFSIPLDNTKEHKILVNLACVKRGSLCASTFGFGTQVDKIIPVQLY